MRRIVATACAALPFGLLLLTGCGGGSDTPSVQAAPTSEAAPATTGAASSTTQPASSVNPCVLVTAADLTKAFEASSVEQVTAGGVEPGNPPVVGEFNERTCSYIVNVPGIYGDNPNEDTGAQFTITVTTQEDNTSGDAWKAVKEGGQLASQGGADISRTEYRPVTNIGDEAFFSGPGWLNAHKGKVIIEVVSVDDTNEIMDNTKAAAVVLQAFARVS